MSAEMATLSRKAVFVTVYVETPRRRRVISFQPMIIPKGCNRKVDLLLYSQRLRDSAQASHHKPESPTRIVPAERKTGNGRRRRPSCFRNWKLLIPNLFKSLKSRKPKKKNNGSTGSKIKAAAIRSQVKKKWGAVSKKFKALRKYR